MAKTYDYFFKLLLVGDSGSGKTQVLFRFANDAFDSTFRSTIGLLCFHFGFVVCLISANSTMLIPPGIRLKVRNIPPAGTVSKGL